MSDAVRDPTRGLFESRYVQIGKALLDVAPSAGEEFDVSISDITRMSKADATGNERHPIRRTSRDLCYSRMERMT